MKLAKRVKTEVDIVEIWESTAAARHCWSPLETISKHPTNNIWTAGEFLIISMIEETYQEIARM